MAQPGQRTGFWRSLRELPGRTPLRVKLIAGVLVLVTVALIAISFVGIYVLRGNLLTQVDAELAGERTRIVNAWQGYGGGPHAQFVGAAATWVPDKGSHQQVLAATNNNGQSTAGPAIPADAASLPSNPQKAVTLGSTSGFGRWRAIGVPVTVQFPGSTRSSSGVLVVAVDADNVYSTLRTLTEIDALVSLAIIVGLAALGTALIRASLRPLTDIEATASAIAAGDLSKRVPERDPRTEVGRLGRSLNAMLSQIEAAFQSRSRSEAEARRSEEKMRQFVGDASHELRTPLTAIRGFAEYYRQRGGVAVGAGPGPAASPAAGDQVVAGKVIEGAAAAGNGSAGRQTPGQLASADMDRIMRRVEQESARMGILVEDMLLLARLDQQRPLEARPVDLLTLAADAVHDARVVAPDRSINLTVGPGRALLVIGDEVRLRQVIGNLMSNALTHTPDGTPIEVLIRPGNLDEAPAPATAEADDAEPVTEPDALDTPAWEGDTRIPPPPPPLDASAAAPPPPHPAAVLEVIDHGPGLTPAQAGHVFERFYRADAARTTGGTGLGLAIVAALVGAHGGAAWVQSAPGQGATFCIALPLSPEAVHDTDDDFDSDTDDMEGTDGAAAYEGVTGAPAASDAETGSDRDTRGGGTGTTSNGTGGGATGATPNGTGGATAIGNGGYTATSSPSGPQSG